MASSSSSSTSSLVSRMRNWISIQRLLNVSESFSSVPSFQRTSRQNSNVSESVNSVTSSQRGTDDLLVPEEIRGRVVLYDVFISHRGSDGKVHAIQIHEDLKRLGVKSFLDVEGIFKGENLSAVTVEAIRSSTVLMVILTKGFAESPWCLEELKLTVEKIKEEGKKVMFDQKENEVVFDRKGKKIVTEENEAVANQRENVVATKTMAVLLPVFYGVEPVDLRNVKRGPFEKAFRMHKKGKEFGSEMIKRWEETLKEVSDVRGLSLSQYKGKDELFKAVVEYVVGKVKNVDFEVAKFPVAIHQRVHELNTVINHTKSCNDTACVIGIVGMTGIGKTTIAKQYYNFFRSSFRSSVFIDDIRGKARSIGLASLQKMLLKELVLLEVHVPNVRKGVKLLKKHLQGSEVLLVLDDVDDVSQLKALMLHEVLSPGSVILVTTSDSLLFVGVPNVCYYSVEKLERHHSRELLLMHSMQKPESSYPELDVLIEQYLDLCDGIPLSLEIIGRSLSGITNKYYWKNNFVKVSEILPEEIKKRLRNYFETLKKFEKDAIFDIACFFEGEKEDVVISFWDACGLPGRDILDILLLKNVVSLVLGRFYIHPQMKQFVLQILVDEIEDSINVRRLWRPNDVQKALEKIFVFTNVEYLSLVVKASQLSSFPASNVIPKSTIICCEKDGVFLGPWPTKCFAMMSNLKLLILEGHCIEMERNLSDLPTGIVWLRWQFYPYGSLPFDLSIGNLRILELSGRNLCNLWDLSYELPLQLQHLYLQGCTGLKSLPISIGMLMHLEVIVLQGCISLTAIPDEICNTQLLHYIDLSGCRILEYLPHNIGYLKMLQHFNCSGCWKLCALPDSFAGLANLVFLDVSECWNLRALPLSVGSLSQLTSLNLFNSGCFNLQIQDQEKIVEAITLLSAIVEMSDLQILKLSIKGFNRLPGSYGQLSSLEVLCIHGPHLVELPWALGSFPALIDLTLDGCLNLKKLVRSIGSLKRLKTLAISSCGLIDLPEEIGELCNLEIFYLKKCKSLSALPTSFGNLLRLKEIELMENSNLSICHDLFQNLSMLTRLVLDECEISDECLTLVLKSLCSIRDLKLKQLKNSHVNFTEYALPNLTSLSIVSCDNVTEFEIFPKLRVLEIVSCLCLELVVVPTGMTMWLRELTLRHCKELSMIKSIDALQHLEKLDTVGCENLHYMEGLELVRTLKEMHIFITYWGFTYHGDEWLQALQINIYAPTMHFATKTVPNMDQIFRNFHKMDHYSNNLLTFELPKSTVSCAWIMIAFSSYDTYDEIADSLRQLNELARESNLPTSDSLIERGNINLRLYTTATNGTPVHEYPSVSAGETIHFSIFTGDSWLCEQLRSGQLIALSSNSSINLGSGWIHMLSIEDESNIETIQSEFFQDLRKEKEAALRISAHGQEYFFNRIVEMRREAQLRENVDYLLSTEHEKKILLMEKKQEEENRATELPDPKISTRSMEDMKSFQALDIANCRITRVNFLITVAIQGHQLTPTIRKQDLFNLPYDNERSLSCLQLEIGTRTAVRDASVHGHNTLIQVTVGENYESFSNIINHEFIHLEASEAEQAILANPFGFLKIVHERFQNVENLRNMLEEAQLRQEMSSHIQFFADEEGVGINLF